MDLRGYLILLFALLNVHGSVIKPISFKENQKEDTEISSNSNSGSSRVPGSRSVLTQDSPFFHHAHHQNSGFRNRPAPIQPSFLLGRTAMARSAQMTDPESCSAVIRCDKTSTKEVSFLILKICSYFAVA